MTKPLLSALAFALTISASASVLASTVSPVAYNPAPGQTTIKTIVGKDGKVVREAVTAPETPEMKDAKKRFLKEAPATCKLTVKSEADSNGKNDTPYGIFVIKDSMMSWKMQYTPKGVFNLPPGDYVVQVVYTDSDFASVFVPVTIDGDSELTVNADMADKSAYIKWVLPSGEDAVFQTLGDDWEPTDDPYNASGLMVVTRVSYKGLSKCDNLVMVEFGGDTYAPYLSLRSNAGDDGTYIWSALGDTEKEVVGYSIVKQSSEVKNGDIFANDFNHYVKVSPEFEYTPAHDEMGGTDGYVLNYSLLSPADREVAGLGTTLTSPKDIYICDPYFDENDYHALMYVSDIDYFDKEWWNTDGVRSPGIANTADGLKYFSTQYGSTYSAPEKPGEYAAMLVNPSFSFPMEEGQVMGSTAPYCVTATQWVTWAGSPFYITDVAGYYGNCGELRSIDTSLSSVEIEFNGSPVDLSGYESLLDWAQIWAYDMHEPGILTFTFRNSNARVDGHEAMNVCELTINEGGSDIVPPTVQRIMIAGLDGMPSNSYDKAEEAIIKIAGGDFMPGIESVDIGDYVGLFDYYTYSPAELEVEIAPRGSDKFTYLTVEADYSKFLMPGYGLYWEAALSDYSEKSADGWFDLRVSLADESGNMQTQVISSALYIDSLNETSGVDNVLDDENVSLFVEDNEVLASDGSDVEVYTLEGVRVANANLSAGAYIAISGRVRAKIFVK